MAMSLEGIAAADELASWVSSPTATAWTRICGWLDDHVDGLDDAQRRAVDDALARLPARVRVMAPQWVIPRLDVARARFARCLDTRLLHGVTSTRLEALADEAAEAGLPLEILALGTTADGAATGAWARALARLPIETLEVDDITGLQLWDDDDPSHAAAVRTLTFVGTLDVEPLCAWLRREELAGLASLTLGGGVYRANLLADPPDPIDGLIDALATLGALRALTIHDERFYRGELTRLAAMLGERLERLDLRTCRLEDDELSELLDGASWPALRALDLSDNLLSRHAMARLGRAPLLSQLSELALGMCGLGGPAPTSEDEAQRMAWVSAFEPKKGRRSGLVALCEGGAERAPASLRVLRVPGNELDADDMARLLDWLRDTRLEVLDLSDNPLHGAPLRVLATAAGQPLRAVTHLDLSACGLDAEAARVLAASPWPALTHLMLTGNRLGADGAAALADARWCASLQVLEVTVADVGAEGMRSLQRAGVVPASPHQVAPEAGAIAEAGDRAWRNLLGHLATLDDNLVGQLPPDVDTTLVEDGVAVVVPQLDPSWTWSSSGRTMTGAGNPEQGFYWLEIGDRRQLQGAWRQLVEALERWRRVVPGRGDPDLSAAPDLPGPWQVAGWSAGPGIEVPSIGTRRSPQAQVGLSVAPFAIWLPGHVLVMLDDAHPGGATYIGEPGATPRYARWIETPPAVAAPELPALARWQLGPAPEAVDETRDGVSLQAAVAVATPEHIELPAQRTRWHLAERLKDCALVFTTDLAHLLVQPYRTETLIVLRTWSSPDGQPWPAMIVEMPAVLRRIVPDPRRPHLVHLFLESGRARLDLSTRRVSRVEPVDRGVFMARVMPDASLWLAIEDPDSYDCELFRCPPTPDDEGSAWGPRESLGRLPRALEDVWADVTVSPSTGQLIRGSMSRMLVGSAGAAEARELEPPAGMRWGGYGLDATGTVLLRVIYPDDEDAGLEARLQWCELPTLAVRHEHVADMPAFVDLAALSPDGQLAVVNGRSALHVWSRDAAASAPLVRHDEVDFDRGLAFSPGGTHLAGANAHGVELWPVGRLLGDKS